MSNSFGIVNQKIDIIFYKQKAQIILESEILKSISCDRKDEFGHIIFSKPKKHEINKQ